MCENCNELLSCPVGEKRRKDLAVSPEPTVVTNGYGQQLRETPWRMVVKRPLDSEPWAMLYQGCNDQHGMNYGAAIIITHCPFCGERLIPAPTRTDERGPYEKH